MLYSEIIAVSSEIHINTLCGQNVELVNVKLAVNIVGFERFKPIVTIFSLTEPVPVLSPQ